MRTGIQLLLQNESIIIIYSVKRKSVLNAITKYRHNEMRVLQFNKLFMFLLNKIYFLITYCVSVRRARTHTHTDLRHAISLTEFSNLLAYRHFYDIVVLTSVRCWMFLRHVVSLVLILKCSSLSNSKSAATVQVFTT